MKKSFVLLSAALLSVTSAVWAADLSTNDEKIANATIILDVSTQYGCVSPSNIEMAGAWENGHTAKQLSRIRSSDYYRTNYDKMSNGIHILKPTCNFLTNDIRHAVHKASNIPIDLSKEEVIVQMVAMIESLQEYGCKTRIITQVTKQLHQKWSPKQLNWLHNDKEYKLHHSNMARGLSMIQPSCEAIEKQIR